MVFETDTETGIIFRIENINKGLSALSQTVTQLKGVAYIGDDNKTKILAKNAMDLTEAIAAEIKELRNIDAVDDVIAREVNERLLMLLRETSFNIDDKKKF